MLLKFSLHYPEVPLQCWCHVETHVCFVQDRRTLTCVFSFNIKAFSHTGAIVSSHFCVCLQEQPEKENVDDDEDKKNPAYVPRRGAFYEHDMRTGEDDEEPAEELK